MSGAKELNQMPAGASPMTEFEAFRRRLLRDGWAAPEEAAQMRRELASSAGELREAHAHVSRQRQLLGAMNDATASLHVALEESVKLQSHYAELLNAHDGGQRRSFTYADWVERVIELQARTEAAERAVRVSPL